MTRQIISIRPAAAADVDGMLAVIASTHLFTPEEFDGVASLMKADLQEPARATGFWAVAEMEGPVGIALYAPERMTNGTFNLLLIAVAANRQGTGIGREIIRYVEEGVVRQGARILLVETSGLATFDRQRRFYTGCGFREEARIAEFYDAGNDKVVFWKKLS